MRFLNSANNILRQMKAMSTKTADNSSMLQFSVDLILVHVLKKVGIAGWKRRRQIRLRDNIRLTYRLDYGDLQSICEVWFQEVYRLPYESTGTGVLVDLGMNIGMTSVWLARKYGFKTIIGLEPVPDNIAVSKINFADNNIVVKVIEAAIGPTDGMVLFADQPLSNLGYVSSTGRPVQMLSMSSVLSELPAQTQVDLVKLDIEGGEEALLNGDLSWTSRVKAIIGEFHPEVMDYPQAIKRLQSAGFSFIPPGSVYKYTTDAFVRPEQIGQ